MKHFIIQEFVPPEIYSQWNDKSLWFLDPVMLQLADFMREFFGKPMTVNNWDSKGTFTLRGFRPPDTLVGGKLSQHKFGRAFDSNINDMTPRDMYNAIIANEKAFIKAGLTTLEHIDSTPTWVHCDVRCTGLDHILIVVP